MVRFNFNKDDFERIRDETEKLYQTFESVHCPYFNEKIAFNAKGLRHLKFKSDQKARRQEDQYPRLKLLYLAPKIIGKSHTVQGVLKTRRLEEQNSNRNRSYTVKDVIFYEFIAVLDNVRVKIIIKEVIGGSKYFWSIIPFWGIDKENSKRILHSGNPQED